MGSNICVRGMSYIKDKRLLMPAQMPAQALSSAAGVMLVRVCACQLATQDIIRRVVKWVYGSRIDLLSDVGMFPAV